MALHTFSGNGAPSTIPTQLQQHYLDTLNKDLYLSTGTDSLADWALIGGAGSSFTTYLALLDTESSYSGKAGLTPLVNDAENALIFQNPDIVKLNDVLITSLADNQILEWDETQSRWVNDYRMTWLNTWSAGTYLESQVVRDGQWTMVANKTTTDRAAPEEDTTAYGIPDNPTWTEDTSSPRAISGYQLTCNEDVVIDSIRFWRPISDTTGISYVGTGRDITDELNPVDLFSVNIPPGDEGWVEIDSLGQSIFSAGTVLEFELITDKSTSSNQWVYSWDLQDITGGVPTTGNFTRSSDFTLLRVHQTDQGGGNRSVDLEELSAGDTIKIEQIGETQRFDEYQVTSDITDQGDYYDVPVLRINNGQALEVGQTCSWSADINANTVPADYVFLPNFWFGNDPYDGGTGEGYFKSNSTDAKVLNQNAYGIDVRAGRIRISDDWDILAFSGGSGGSTGGGGGATTFTELTDTPNSYVGAGTFVVRVNATENGLEFVDSSTLAPVTSVFGRTGDVVAESGDYTADQVGAYTTAETDQAISDGIQQHEAQVNPHPQYLLPEDLPSTVTGYFADSTNTTDGAYRDFLRTPGSNIEASITEAISTVNENPPSADFIGQWLDDTELGRDYVFQTSPVRTQLDLEVDDTNLKVILVYGLRESGGTLTPIGTTEITGLQVGRFIYSASFTIPAGTANSTDRVYGQIWATKNTNTPPDPTLTFYYEGTYISRYAATANEAQLPLGGNQYDVIVKNSSDQNDASWYNTLSINYDTPLITLNAPTRASASNNIEVDSTINGGAFIGNGAVPATGGITVGSIIRSSGNTAGGYEYEWTSLIQIDTSPDKITLNADTVVNNNLTMSVDVFGGGSGAFIGQGSVPTGGLQQQALVKLDDQNYNNDWEYRTNWKNQWVTGTYYTQDMVIDGAWTMIANKTTTERAGIQDDGDPAYFLPDDPSWTNQSDTPLSGSGINLEILDWVRITHYRVWRPTDDPSFSFIVIGRDVTDSGNPETLFTNTLEPGPIGWVEFTPEGTNDLVGPGIIIELEIVTLNDGAINAWNRQWAKDNSTDVSTAPSDRFWKRNTSDTVILIAKVDWALNDASADLAALKDGDTIQFVEANAPGYFQEYLVEGTGTDEGTYYRFNVELIDQGQQIRNNQLCDVKGNVRVPGSSPYVELPNYFTGAGDYANPQGFRRNNLDDPIVLTNNAYGADIEGVGLIKSDDWDIVAFSGNSAAGGGGQGPDTFLDLVDTPDSYSGQAGLAVVVRGDELGLEFASSVGTDELVKISSNDTTAGFLNGKLVAGTAISLTEDNDGGNETLTVATTAEANTAANVGSGQGNVFRDKTGVTLNLKTLLAGTGITITDQADDILITSTAIGTDELVGATTNDTTPDYLNAKLAGTGRISTALLNPGANEQVQISTTAELNTGSNLGAGQGNVFAQKVGEELQFKSLVQGTNVSITEDGDEITINATAAPSTDELVGVSANDTTPGYLIGKLVAGTNITLVENNDGGDETLTINSTASGGGGLPAGGDLYDTLVKNSSTDQDASWNSLLQIGVTETTIVAAASFYTGGTPAAPTQANTINDAFFGQNAQGSFYLASESREANTGSQGCVYIGNNVGNNTSNGDRGVFIGADVAPNHTGAIDCVGLGTQSLNSLTSASGSLGIGFASLESITTGVANIGIGSQSMRFTGTGVNNSIGIGGRSLISMLSGANAVGIGNNITRDNTGPGNFGNSTFLGNDAARSPSTDLNNCTFIGRQAGRSTTQADRLIIGDTSQGEAGVFISGDFTINELTINGSLVSTLFGTVPDTTIANEQGNTPQDGWVLTIDQTNAPNRGYQWEDPAAAFAARLRALADVNSDPILEDGSVLVYDEPGDLFRWEGPSSRSQYLADTAAWSSANDYADNIFTQDLPTGVYAINFSSTIWGTNASQDMRLAIFRGDTIIPESERFADFASTGASDDLRYPVHTQAIIVVTSISEQISIRTSTNAGTVNIGPRSLIVSRV